MTQTLEVPELPEALLQAAAAHGPGDTTPPHVRTPFPTFVLPPVLRRFVEETADALGVPPECVATPAMAACATAIGNSCRLRLTSTWKEPAILWAVVLMESGSLKTPAYNAAVEPLHLAQQRLEQEFARDKDAYRHAKANYEADAAFWNSQPAPDRPETPPTEPVEPTPEDLFASDSTVEALAILFQNNPRGLAFTRDELSGFFGSFGAYKGGRGGDEAAYLEFYNAGVLKVNRAGGKRLFAGNAALSIFGTCQPAVFLRAIGVRGHGPNQIENGLASRFILAAPELRAKTWREDKPVTMGPYLTLIAGLLALPLPRTPGGALAPAEIPLEPEAKARFKDFVNAHGQHAKSFENPPLRYHYSKLEGVAARLALIFYLCDRVTNALTGPNGEYAGEGVQERHVLAGIALARWYGREAQRVYGRQETEEERQMWELLDKIDRYGGVITARQMVRSSRRWKDTQTAEEALMKLESEGFGRFVWENGGPEGGRPSKVFRLCDAPGVDEPLAGDGPPGGYVDRSVTLN